MKLNKDMKILIVGLGLIGGSYAEALSKKGYEVGAIDQNKKLSTLLCARDISQAERRASTKTT